MTFAIPSICIKCCILFYKKTVFSGGKFNLKKSILISIILISFIGAGIGGYFLINELVMNSLEKRVKITAVTIPEEINASRSINSAVSDIILPNLTQKRFIVNSIINLLKFRPT